ncbi:MAG: hypothetical protein ABIG10_02020 [bacterium]
MKKNKLLQISFLSSVGLAVYIALVALLIQDGEKLFGKLNNLWGPLLFLMLFVFSALVSGLLVLGYPIWLYLEKEKKAAIKLLFYTLGWIFIFLLAIIAIVII